ncbi:MAG TPA: hypothetical protein VN698_10565 [Bacteroidia bacterium]|nr:hypothetical protein [Bacteroidia bacterium]
MATKIKSQTKIFILLYVLFLICLYGWFYFDRRYSICAVTDLAKNTNSGCFVYKDISDFCFFGWILTLIMLLVFTVNNVMKNGAKALKTPALVILTTGILFAIAELCFMMIFKR